MRGNTDTGASSKPVVLWLCCMRTQTFTDNPLTEFVELPEDLRDLKYCNLLTGVIKGALEMVRGGRGPCDTRCSCPSVLCLYEWLACTMLACTGACVVLLCALQWDCKWPPHTLCRAASICLRDRAGQRLHMAAGSAYGPCALVSAPHQSIAGCLGACCGTGRSQGQPHYIVGRLVVACVPCRSTST